MPFFKAHFAQESVLAWSFPLAQLGGGKGLPPSTNPGNLGILGGYANWRDAILCVRVPGNAKGEDHVGLGGPKPVER